VPYSAVPYSAVPQSGAPYSVAPHSPAPQQSAYLQSRGARGGAPAYSHTPAPKPRYRDDAYSTGARPLYSYEPPAERPAPAYREEPRRDERPAYRDHEDERPEARRPSYPDAWGTAPERQLRPEWRTGPRARFSR
jgi:hypothetical protein